jgi:hypothetical protein
VSINRRNICIGVVCLYKVFAANDMIVLFGLLGDVNKRAFFSLTEQESGPQQTVELNTRRTERVDKIVESVSTARVCCVTPS